ncbi:hypothetical protein [Desulfogranum japonicum]|uniref:hypothetical protein n=1 Tax=Desulfogranum japonicum TaxID=231447 RepID=UPI000427FE88|nr:hypothetical protein [Desulfogranum japonicum]
MTTAQQELASFVENWEESAEGNKKAFERLYTYMQTLEKAALTFFPRPGVTYSLRGVLENDPDNTLFVMVDVIEDSPRWLSVCFYGAMIHDAEEKGAFVPGGLLGQDAVCFDLEEYNEKELTYVEQRIAEAYAARCKGV